ncbi:MAG: ABC transporter substrate-binding protein [Acidimicrobiia bacterium]
MKRMVTRSTAVAAVLALALGLAACSSSKSSSSGSGSANLPECPIGAIDKASKPVNLVFWHSAQEENEKALKALTDKFNASQTDVKVTLVKQASYEETLTKWQASLANSTDLPGLVMLEDVALQNAIDSQNVLPAQSCVNAEKYDLSQFLPRVTSYYTVNKVLWPMPFNVSNPVMYYNKKLFAAAGLDPNKPPTTFDELKSAAEKLKGSVAVPISFKLDPWYSEMWLALQNKVYVNNGNGRDKPATQVEFNNPDGVAIWTFLDGLKKAGLLNTTPGGGFDNLLALGNVNAAITFDTSAALGTAVVAIGAGTFPQFTLNDVGVAPLPKPTGSASGGTYATGGAIYITKAKASPPAVQEAAWRFAKYLNIPENQAQFAGQSGYIPITEAAANTQTIKDLWAKYPFYKVAYDQLNTGPQTDATAGPVVGNATGQRKEVTNAMQAMFNGGLSPQQAVNQAATNSNNVIQQYNASVGR